MQRREGIPDPHTIQGRPQEESQLPTSLLGPASPCPQPAPAVPQAAHLLRSKQISVPNTQMACSGLSRDRRMMPWKAMALPTKLTSLTQHGSFRRPWGSPLPSPFMGLGPLQPTPSLRRLQQLPRGD